VAPLQRVPRGLSDARRVVADQARDVREGLLVRVGGEERERALDLREVQRPEERSGHGARGLSCRDQLSGCAVLASGQSAGGLGDLLGRAGQGHPAGGLVGDGARPEGAAVWRGAGSGRGIGRVLTRLRLLAAGADDQRERKNSTEEDLDVHRFPEV